MPSSPPGDPPPVMAILCLLAVMWLVAIGISVLAIMR
jgi:hypothetical protein